MIETMDRIGRWIAQLTIAAVVGVIAGLGAGLVWHHDHHRSTAASASPAAAGGTFPPSSDQLTAIGAGLLRDHLYVASNARTILDPAGRRRVATAIADSPVPVYVAVLAPGQHIGVSEIQIGQALATQLPDRDGVLYVWQGPQAGEVVVLGPHDGVVPRFGSALDFVGAADVTLPKAVRAAAHTDFGDNVVTRSAGSRSADRTGVGVFSGVLLALAVVVVLTTLAWLVTRMAGRRIPGRWTWREDPR